MSNKVSRYSFDEVTLENIRRWLLDALEVILDIVDKTPQWMKTAQFIEILIETLRNARNDARDNLRGFCFIYDIYTDSKLIEDSDYVHYHVRIIQNYVVRILEKTAKK